MLARTSSGMLSCAAPCPSLRTPNEVFYPASLGCSFNYRAPLLNYTCRLGGVFSDSRERSRALTAGDRRPELPVILGPRIARQFLGPSGSVASPLSGLRFASGGGRRRSPARSRLPMRLITGSHSPTFRPPALSAGSSWCPGLPRSASQAVYCRCFCSGWPAARTLSAWPVGAAWKPEACVCRRFMTASLNLW